MVRYSIIGSSAHKHYIDIIVKIDTRGKDKLEVLLPAWRPGRYELANYAQNIQYWQVFDEKENRLKSYKKNKNTWIIESNGAAEVTICYNYYANQLDAGASYFDEKQLYINPVNCLVYLNDRINEPCELKLEHLPDHYQLVSAIPFDAERKAVVKDFHTLADSPLMAAAVIQHEKYTVGMYNFHIWMLGNVSPDWPRILSDFQAFSNKQVEMFGELPVSTYHFLFQLPDQKFYHGVEHLDSTVICLGPAYRLMHAEIYTEFTGISSHELFHSWNVKSIRPVEMMPYDYSRENYTPLYYVAEGVTTYYGDMMLLRSGVYDWNLFAIETAKVLEKHLHNYGRFYQTLAEASMDSWLDGYKPGTPDRKISFYLKGMAVAWALDINIRRDTHNMHSLDSVMKTLYFDFAKQGKGYSEADYLEIISSIAGKDYREFFEKYVWGLNPVEDALHDAFKYIGCTLATVSNPFYYEHKLGFRLGEPGPFYKSIISNVAPGSPADAARLSPSDEIVAINGIYIERNLDEILKMFSGTPVQLSFIRNKELLITTIIEGNESFYPNYLVLKQPEATEAQKENFRLWAHQEF
jgi:predicted metalloprotease with PDZ domain